MTETAISTQPPSHWRRFRALYLLLAVCVVPVIASYTAYYLMPPSGRTNYGALIEPQRPLPELTLRRLDGTAVPATSLRGSWLMVQVDAGACEAACQKKLWQMRQVRLTTGKDAGRVRRVWLIVDDAPLATAVIREFATQTIRNSSLTSSQPKSPAPKPSRLRETHAAGRGRPRSARASSRWSCR